LVEHERVESDDGGIDLFNIDGIEAEVVSLKVFIHLEILLESLI
jgi:hypothetical protein